MTLRRSGGSSSGRYRRRCTRRYWKGLPRGRRWTRSTWRSSEWLQRDETKPLSEIQKETGINYKTLSFHHRKHVLGKQMLKGHKVNWLGTGYNPENDRGKHRRHTYQPIDIILRDITPGERATVMGLTNALPFLWFEASGRSSYYAQLVFPTETISEAMEFLARALLPVKDRARWFMVDQKHSLSFSLEPRLYDNESRSGRSTSPNSLRSSRASDADQKRALTLGRPAPDWSSRRNHAVTSRGETCTPSVAKTTDAPVRAIMPYLTFSSRVMVSLSALLQI